MEEWQLRVIEEQRELRLKIEKLCAMIYSARFDKVPTKAANQLVRQYDAMKLYDEVLRERILDFEGA